MAALSLLTPVSMASEQEDAPTLRFTSVRDLFETIDRVPGDFLVVTNVDPGAFAKIDRGRFRAHRPRRFRLRRYDADTNTLVITIPTELHEALHRNIYNAFLFKLVGRDQVDSWKEIGATTFFVRGHPGGNGGEGDSAGGPDPERAGLGEWPTLVVEAGVSESLGELHNDMRWWFLISEHQVKIVLLVKFDYGQREIIIERWEEESQARPGATTTRNAAAQLQPIRKQRITITQNEGTPASYTVTSGELVLSFRLLFLRAPGPEDGDIIISLEELKTFAQRIWRSVRA